MWRCDSYRCTCSAFGPGEAAVLHQAPTGPFAAGTRLHNLAVSGDLSALGNFSQMWKRREERFTTDAYGFRNPPEIVEQHRPVAALLNGDSFSAGAALDDAMTLSAQLSRRLGKTVYNAAGRRPARDETGTTTPTGMRAASPSRSSTSPRPGPNRSTLRTEGVETGKGTGLGLSISYDIVVQGNGVATGEPSRSRPKRGSLPSSS